MPRGPGFLPGPRSFCPARTYHPSSMDGLLSFLGTLFDLALVLGGFTLIIVIHELGHFLAARWAGIRVLAFAVGFGPALCSYRRGLGWRRGSSEDELVSIARRAGRTIDEHAIAPPLVPGVSATEYRVNLLPLGGYVKMLGQDDADPSARSAAADSYQSAPVWKRMVVISAGVIFNLITAALIFVVVFTAGLETEPATIGDVRPESPAARALALNAAEAGVTRPGLQPGDRVLQVDGETPDSFKDVALAAAMASRGHPVDLTVAREGVEQPLRFAIVPSVNDQTRILDLGVGVAAGNEVLGRGWSPARRAEIARTLAGRGLDGIEPGMRLVGVEGRPARSFYDLQRAVAASRGLPVNAEFETDAGERRGVTLTPAAELPTALYDTPLGRVEVEELLGLTPVIKARQVRPESGGAAAGLVADDVFMRLGDLEWPNIPEAILEINRGKRTTIPITVARGASPDAWTPVDLGPVPVKRGVVGFDFTSTAATSPVLARYPRLLSPVLTGELATLPPAQPGTPSGAGLDLAPGSLVLSVNGTPVSTLAEIRNALQSAAEGHGAGSFTARLRVRPPLADRAAAAAAEHEVDWTLRADEIVQLKSLGWTSPLPSFAFLPEKTVLRGDTPGQAIALGLRETRRVMVSTYLTFARLFEGTVRVEHLKGPVGIAHVGTLLADRGVIWLLFFMAVISVNLAVINFLPLPIVDGGQFVFLLWEGITGRPVSVLVLNIATLAGLALIGSVFLVVTFNDLARLFWR